MPIDVRSPVDGRLECVCVSVSVLIPMCGHTHTYVPAHNRSKTDNQSGRLHIRFCTLVMVGVVCHTLWRSYTWEDGRGAPSFCDSKLLTPLL